MWEWGLSYVVLFVDVFVVLLFTIFAPRTGLLYLFAFVK
jgi:hypothetical protein